ncbi:DNA primase [Ralstonia phage PQ43W]
MESISFTQITATNCELTKTFSRNSNGGIESTAIAHMTEGRAMVVTIPTPAHLSTLFPLLQPNQAFTCGVPAVGNTPLTTRAGAEFRRDAVARTNESFVFPYGAALFPIDVDVDGAAFGSVDAVLDALEACSPWMRSVHRVARPSSSSFVAGRGLRGVHVYLVVTRGTDIPALAKRMQIEQWAAGRGHIKISKSGALLVRQLSDALVYQPSRLMFEAAPVLRDGVEREVPHDQAFIERAPQTMGAPAKYRSPQGFLDVQLMPALREIEERRFQTAVRAAKNARRREAKTVAIDYQRQNALAAGLDETAGERYGLLATRALGDKALPLSWMLHVQGVGPVTVGHVLANIDDALGFYCADPFDTWRPDLSPKHLNKAEIVRMGDTPGVWSHKLQEFFAFTDDDAADLASPLDLAAEKLCGLVDYPEASGKKTAPFVNVLHGLELLLREIDLRPAHNLCTGLIEREDVPTVGRLVEALSRIGCANVTAGGVDRAIDALAEMHTIDPWKDAVLNLPQWDGVSRLGSVFEDTFGAEPSIALARATEAFFAGIVRRQLEPGAPAPVVPVLIGPQGLGKSRFVVEIARALGVPPPASIAFGDDRRMSMAASGSVIAELAEMSGLSKRDADDVKRWVTDDNDTYRAPYAKQEEQHPRRFMPIGTANKHELNRDETGNRRFMPVFVTRPLDANWTVEIRQVLAEAKRRFCDDEAAYHALVREASDLVYAYNQNAMLRGEGIPTSDLDDLLPNILRQQVRMSPERRVASAAIRGALDSQVTGRRVSAQEISRWLVSRGWTVGKDGYGMRFYAAPEDFIDNPANVCTLNTVNPFTEATS